MFHDLSQLLPAPGISCDETKSLCQIAELLWDLIAPQGVGVVIRATHLCMSMRGAKKANAHMRTSFLMGTFLENPKTRREFFDSIERPG